MFFINKLSEWSVKKLIKLCIMKSKFDTHIGGDQMKHLIWLEDIKDHN